jgi:hypothetical protein
MAPRGLGRVEHFESGNLAYLISDRVADSSAKKVALLASRGKVPTADNPNAAVPAMPVSKYHYDSAWWGNQHDTPQCTEFCGLHLMADGPVTHPRQNPLVPSPTLYHEIQAIDRAEGRVYDEGATSLAMAKAMRARGWIGEYLWGYTLADFIRGIRPSPIALGIDWYSGFDEPDAKGRVKLTGYVRGGHEILANGCDFNDGWVRLKNRWGREWGHNGHCYVSFEDLEKLIASGGDVCMMRELKVAA